MEFNSSAGYKIIKQVIKNFLKAYNFQSYKSATVYRITSGDILQFVNCQKGVQSLNDKMTFNIVVQGLYSPTSSFDLLQPGCRIGELLSDTHDTWWYCNDKNATLNSIDDIKENFRKFVIPFFNETSDSDSICKLIKEKRHEYVWNNLYTFIDIGFHLLKAKQYNDAIDIFQSNQPSKVPKFKTIQKLVEQEMFREIDEILTENILYSKKKLKI